MDTLTAFAMGQANKGKELKVFDWDRAAEIIKERKPKVARAGLAGDWGHTGGTIYEDGEIVDDDYTYLASNWATPELEIDGEIIACYKMESETDYNSSTKWPNSATKILCE
jgi:hypothetical protein